MTETTYYVMVAAYPAGALLAVAACWVADALDRVRHRH